MPFPWPDASAPDDEIATAKTPASSSPTERPKAYKICLQDFDPTLHGHGYLRLTAGDKIQDAEPPEDSEEQAYGRLLLPDNRLSAPG